MHNLLIVRLQHAPTGWFDKHQLALVQGVGAIEIDPLLCLPEFDMQLTPVRLLARGLLQKVRIMQLLPDALRGGLDNNAAGDHGPTLAGAAQPTPRSTLAGAAPPAPH